MKRHRNFLFIKRFVGIGCILCLVLGLMLATLYILIGNDTWADIKLWIAGFFILCSIVLSISYLAIYFHEELYCQSCGRLFEKANFQTFIKCIQIKEKKKIYKVEFSVFCKECGMTSLIEKKFVVNSDLEIIQKKVAEYGRLTFGGEEVKGKDNKH